MPELYGVESAKSRAISRSAEYSIRNGSGGRAQRQENHHTRMPSDENGALERAVFLKVSCSMGVLLDGCPLDRDAQQLAPKSIYRALPKHLFPDYFT